MTPRGARGPVLLCAALGAALAVGACSKKEPAGGAGPSPAVSTSSSAASGASGAPAASATTTPTTRWAGKYTATPGTIYVPDGGEWAHTTWRGDESKEGLGAGEVSLEIEGDAVHGSLGGPLGPAVIVGTSTDGRVAAHIARKDAHDGGFTGTLEGTLSGTSLRGTMHLTRATADVIREATFELTTTTGK